MTWRCSSRCVGCMIIYRLSLDRGTPVFIRAGVTVHVEMDPRSGVYDVLSDTISSPPGLYSRFCTITGHTSSKPGCCPVRICCKTLSMFSEVRTSFQFRRKSWICVFLTSSKAAVKGEKSSKGIFSTVRDFTICWKARSFSSLRPSLSASR